MTNSTILALAVALIASSAAQAVDGGCHTPGAMAGQPDAAKYLAGADMGFGVPGLGVFYPPNLTPDPEFGLGTWSEEDIIRAVRTARGPTAEN